MVSRAQMHWRSRRRRIGRLFRGSRAWIGFVERKEERWALSSTAVFVERLHWLVQQIIQLKVAVKSGLSLQPCKQSTRAESKERKRCFSSKSEIVSRDSCMEIRKLQKLPWWASILLHVVERALVLTVKDISVVHFERICIWVIFKILVHICSWCFGSKTVGVETPNRRVESLLSHVCCVLRAEHEWSFTAKYTEKECVLDRPAFGKKVPYCLRSKIFMKNPFRINRVRDKLPHIHECIQYFRVHF